MEDHAEIRGSEFMYNTLERSLKHTSSRLYSFSIHVVQFATKDIKNQNPNHLLLHFGPINRSLPSQLKHAYSRQSPAY